MRHLKWTQPFSTCSCQISWLLLSTTLAWENWDLTCFICHISRTTAPSLETLLYFCWIIYPSIYFLYPLFHIRSQGRWSQSPDGYILDRLSVYHRATVMLNNRPYSFIYEISLDFFFSQLQSWTISGLNAQSVTSAWCFSESYRGYNLPVLQPLSRSAEFSLCCFKPHDSVHYLSRWVRRKTDSILQKQASSHVVVYFSFLCIVIGCVI